MKETTREQTKILSDTQIKNRSYGISNTYTTYPYKKRDANKYLENKESSRHYIRKGEESTHKYAIDYDTYMTVVRMLLAEVWEDITKGYIVTFPRLGKFGFRRYKTNPDSKIIDWKKTNELYGEWNKNNKEKKRVYMDNSHTYNWALQATWLRPTHPGALHTYKFIFSRVKKSQLAKSIKAAPEQIFNFESK